MIPKYKVWDEVDKRMWNVETLFIEDEWVRANDGSIYGEHKDIVRSFELMQSTQLKDKNGVEIFEGDIVSCFNEGLSTVVFRYGNFGLICNGYFEGFINVLGSFEVIGNIYENGDLLK